MRLPCHGECHIPDGFLEREKERIDALHRIDFIERIQHRNKLMGFPTSKDECERVFEEQILEAGMTLEEARAVLYKMHETNMRMQERGRKTKI